MMAIGSGHEGLWLSILSMLCFTVVLIAVAGIGMAASYSLYSDDFSGDLSVWTVEGAWRLQNGTLATNSAAALASMGRRDWRNYLIDARIDVKSIQEGGYLRLLGRRQANGDAFALEIAAHELRLVSIDATGVQVLVRMPISVQPGQPHVVRLGLFENTLVGQFDNEKTITCDLDAALHSSRAAGLVGLAARGAELAVDAVEVLSLDSTFLPRSNLRPDPGYLPPGTEVSAGARDIMLIYSGYYPNGAGEWIPAEAMPFIAYGKPGSDLQFIDWFFDTFLFLGLQAPSGRAFDSPSRGPAANMDDWQWYLDSLFQETRQIGAFNEGLNTLKLKLNDPDYKAKVIIMIPHAIPTQTNFGDVDGDGVSENFSPQPQGVDKAEAARWKAVKWYIDEVERRWKEAGYAHLELLGYYWLDEHLGMSYGLTPDVLTRRTSEYIHGIGRKLFWIPYYQATGYEKAYEIGFDSVMMQPNYMFNTDIPQSRLESTAQIAKREHFGVEIEADGTVLNSAAGRERYLDYLRAGVTYGYMKNAIHAYYQGAKVYLDAFFSLDPGVRGIYDATYAFVKGIYNEALK